LSPADELSVPSVMPSSTAGTLCIGSRGIGSPSSPDGWPLGPTTGRMCGLGTGWMPRAERRDSEAIGINSGIG
jgi:hypothetical protein